MDASLPTTLNAITAIQPGKGPAYRQAHEDAYFAGMEAGQRLRATVRGHLSNGDFVVMLSAFAGKDGHELQMKLPSSFRPGDALNLIFLSREPRPTFRLPVEIAPAAAYSTLLSGTGRFIHDLMQGPTVPGTPAALSSAAPLLTAPPADAARLLQLAQGLARVVAQSGLFYESHLAQWVAGQTDNGGIDAGAPGTAQPAAPVAQRRRRCGCAAGSTQRWCQHTGTASSAFGSSRRSGFGPPAT